MVSHSPLPILSFAPTAPADPTHALWNEALFYPWPEQIPLPWEIRCLNILVVLALRPTSTIPNLPPPPPFYSFTSCDSEITLPVANALSVTRYDSSFSMPFRVPSPSPVASRRLLAREWQGEWQVRSWCYSPLCWQKGWMWTDAEVGLVIDPCSLSCLSRVSSYGDPPFAFHSGNGLFFRVHWY